MSNILHSSSFELSANSLDVESGHIDEVANSVRTRAVVDPDAINTQNRSQDLFAMIMSVFVMFCIIASFACVIGWMAGLVVGELSNWNLQELMRGVHGNM